MNNTYTHTTRTRSLAAALLAAIAAVSPARAADATWNVDAAGNWATDASWNPAAAPGATTGSTSTDTATFGTAITAARIVTVDTNRNIFGINFAGNSFAYTLSSGSLILSNGGLIQTSGAGTAHTDIISAPITLVGDATFGINTTTAARILQITTGGVTGSSTQNSVLTLDAVGTSISTANAITANISNGTGFTTNILKTGAGLWTLSGNKSYTGTTTIQNGTLRASAASALGVATSAVALGDATSISSNYSPTLIVGNGGGSLTIARDITVGASTSSTSGIYTIKNDNATNAWGISGNVTLNQNLTIANQSSSAGTFSGVIGGSGGLTIGATGATATIALTNANTFTGDTRIALGKLQIDANNASVTGQLQNSTLDMATGDTGVLEFRGSTGTTAATFGGLKGSRNIALTNTIPNAVALSVGNNNQSTTYSGVLSGTGSLTKIGTGTLTLSGNNTYTGATTVNAGTLALGAANRISDSSALTLAGGTFTTGGFSETLNTLTVTSNSFLDFGTSIGSGLVFTDSHAINWTGSVTLLNFDVGTDTLNFSSISGLTVAQLAGISLAGYTATGLDASGFVQFTSAIPEPSTYAAILGALALGGVVLRRRRRA